MIGYQDSSPSNGCHDTCPSDRTKQIPSDMSVRLISSLVPVTLGMCGMHADCSNQLHETSNMLIACMTCYRMKSQYLYCVVFILIGQQLRNILPLHCCSQYHIPVLKIRTICNARDLWKFASPCKQLHLLCLPNPWNLPGAAILSGFQSPQGALKSMEWDST